MPFNRYHAYEPVDLPDRTWPSKTITKAPVWCSVDLRDGNQSLINPMNGAKKERMFSTLVQMGFKEIEVGFPAASDTDFNFCRYLIERGLIPEDVTIQVLTQARRELIERTFQAIDGAPSAIVHLYNSTSTLQRKVVFKSDMDGVKKIATDGAAIVKELIPTVSKDTKVRLQYSPESFTGTELDYALEVSEAVMDVWESDAANPAIINLPATVEMSTPNIYADQIEWMHRNFRQRDRVILSLHPHNDRGTGVAAAELGVMAGADRIEGTLFGNGERTGNVDIITLGMNLFSQGVDPTLDFSDMAGLIETAEYCNELKIPERHPYAGELVFTAFSGSHQDAINKGMAALKEANTDQWEVPYLPIDPADVGRTYEAIIRVNSQSGKGGVAYLLESEYGIKLSRGAQIEFAKVVQAQTDETSQEITALGIWQLFEKEYLLRKSPYELAEFDFHPVARGSHMVKVNATVIHGGKAVSFEGTGNGPIEAFVKSFRETFDLDFRVLDYQQFATGTGSDAKAITCLDVKAGERNLFGIGLDQSTSLSSIQAVVSAVNRM
ncbi:MAG: 2-isopropylmalate synthase [Alphaproteobacteria bacterium]|nr:2-isopropylmalate synthase [Alphaproteobacteria bacterium]